MSCDTNDRAVLRTAHREVHFYSHSRQRCVLSLSHCCTVASPQTLPTTRPMASARPDYFQLDPIARDQARAQIMKLQSKILYSEKYFDDESEYRHVILPKELGKLVPRQRLMDEAEWRQLGVQQSVGWKHYMIHRPEPHILLFKRSKTM
jgi:cyclin-dependent kinase regulatory subunit CKS1